jgi:AcrR family transcriptional regulator
MGNKEETKGKILEALGRVIENKGVQAAGVNSVASEAGVDKVLIYRYFGGIDGLLSEYISGIDFFANVTRKFGSLSSIRTKEELIAAVKRLFAEQMKEMTGNTVLREILIWELSADNEISRKIARQREANSMKLIREIKKRFDFIELDIEGTISIISAAVSYLAIRSKTADVYTGISLTSRQGQNRFEKTIGSLIDIMSK